MSTLNFAARLRSLLPWDWFPGDAPVLNAALSGMDAQLTDLFAQLDYLRAQTRLTTATGPWLEGRIADYLGLFPRRIGEQDTAYSLRGRREILRPRATRAALVRALGDEIGLPDDTPALYLNPNTGAIELDASGAAYITAPASRASVIHVFEPSNASDTGGARGLLGGGGGMMVGGPGVPGIGGAGSLELPFDFFVDLPRPNNGGLAGVAGASTGAGGASGLSSPVGGLAASSLDQISVGATDDELYACVSRVLPAGTKAWVRLTGAMPPTPAVWGRAVGGSATWAVGD